MLRARRWGWLLAESTLRHTHADTSKYSESEYKTVTCNPGERPELQLEWQCDRDLESWLLRRTVTEGPVSPSRR